MGIRTEEQTAEADPKKNKTFSRKMPPQLPELPNSSEPLTPELLSEIQLKYRAQIYEYGCRAEERPKAYSLLFGISKKDFETATQKLSKRIANLKLEEERDGEAKNKHAGLGADFKIMKTTKNEGGSKGQQQSYVDIIGNDSKRAFSYFNASSGFDQAALVEKKRELKAMLLCLIEEKEDWNYYQGLNCIAEALYLEYGVFKAYVMLVGLCKYFFEPYMLGTSVFQKSLQKEMALAYFITKSENPELDDILDEGNASTNGTIDERMNFCASWFLTLVSYKIKNHQDVLCLIDFVITSPKQFTMSYLVAALLLTILNTNKITPLTDSHEILTCLFSAHLEPGPEILNFADELLSAPKYELHKLEKQLDKINKVSILKNIKNKLFGIFS